MGAKQSSNPRVPTYPGTAGSSAFAVHSPDSSRSDAGRSNVSTFGPSTSSGIGRSRTRSLGNAMHNGGGANGGQARPLSIPCTNGGTTLAVPNLGAGSPDSDSSTPEDGVFRGFMHPSSLPLPVHLLPLNGINCPVCSKFIPSEDIECHLVMCLTKPRISYNEDILAEDKDEECVICLELLKTGDVIARLQCLCIYHKSCIDSWFKVNRSCPEHPND